MKLRNQIVIALAIMVLLCQMSLAENAQNISELFPPVNSYTAEDLTGKTHDEINNIFWKVINEKQDELALRYRQWPMEGLVWVTELESAFGLDIIPEKYALPTKEDLSSEQIIEIAKQEIASAFQWNASDLTPFEVSFSQFNSNSEYYWYVSFTEGGYVLLTRGGEPIAHEEHNKLLPKDQYNRDGAMLTTDLALEQYAELFFMWPLETQAMLSRHGMPASNHIQQDVAARLATEALSEKIGLSVANIEERYTAYPAFLESEFFERESTDLDAWCFVFYEKIDAFYMVYLDATTGEIREITKSYEDGKG